MKLIYPIVKTINIVLIVLTLISYLSPYVDPAGFWVISIMGLLYPWILIMNILFMIFWWFSSKPWWSLLSLGVILLGWTYLTGFFGFNAKSAHIEQETLLIMSFNIQSLQVAQKKGKNDKDALLEEIQTYVSKFGGPDIVCVQDLIDENIPFFNQYFNLPHYHVLDKQRVKTGIFTRYPIKEKGFIHFEKSFNSCIWADLDVDGQLVRVYSMHLESNRISDHAENVITTGNLKEESTWFTLRNMFARYKRSSVLRSRQAALIAEHVSNSPYPVILCGDLNDTPLSKAYHLVKSDLQDAFRRKGGGLGTTYAGAIPGLRIDYIFADKQFYVLDYKILKDKAFSDHYPVLSNLVLKE